MHRSFLGRLWYSSNFPIVDLMRSSDGGLLVGALVLWLRGVSCVFSPELFLVEIENCTTLLTNGIKSRNLGNKSWAIAESSHRNRKMLQQLAWANKNQSLLSSQKCSKRRESRQCILSVFLSILVVCFVSLICLSSSVYWHHSRKANSWHSFWFLKITYIEEENEIWFSPKQEGLKFRLWKDIDRFKFCNSFKILSECWLVCGLIVYKQLRSLIDYLGVI